MGGRLWFSSCQTANTDLPEELPTSFRSADDYVSAFEALLFEEAREGIRGEWAVRAAMGRGYESDIAECVPQPSAVPYPQSRFRRIVCRDICGIDGSFALSRVVKGSFARRLPE